MTQANYSTIQSTHPSVGTAELQPAWQYEHLDVNNDTKKVRGNGLWMPDVRKAIAMSVNKPDLIAAVFPGANVRVTSGAAAGQKELSAAQSLLSSGKGDPRP